MHNMTGIKKIKELLKNCKLQWFGHVEKVGDGKAPEYLKKFCRWWLEEDRPKKIQQKVKKMHIGKSVNQAKFQEGKDN